MNKLRFVFSLSTSHHAAETVGGNLDFCQTDFFVDDSKLGGGAISVTWKLSSRDGWAPWKLISAKPRHPKEPIKIRLAIFMSWLTSSHHSMMKVFLCLISSWLKPGSLSWFPLLSQAGSASDVSTMSCVTYAVSLNQRMFEGEGGKLTFICEF